MRSITVSRAAWGSGRIGDAEEAADRAVGDLGHDAPATGPAYCAGSIGLRARTASISRSGIRSPLS